MFKSPNIKLKDQKKPY